MSYQTAERDIAARVADVLQQFECSAFMAHEHIQVSGEWRQVILEEIGRADIFVPILSSNYYNSIWCKQESGIAAFRGTTIIPLSIDGSIPEGFISHIQSTLIDPMAPTYINLLPGIVKHNIEFAINNMISRIGSARNYRSAENHFAVLQPYLNKATQDQIVNLLNISADNDQIHDAILCATHYLPPLFQSHSVHMDNERRAKLRGVLQRYNRPT